MGVCRGGRQVLEPRQPPVDDHQHSDVAAPTPEFLRHRQRLHAARRVAADMDGTIRCQSDDLVGIARGQRFEIDRVFISRTGTRGFDAVDRTVRHPRGQLPERQHFSADAVDEKQRGTRAFRRDRHDWRPRTATPGRVEGPRHRGNRRPLEQRAQRQATTGRLFDPREQPDAQQRVSAGFEEVIVRAHVGGQRVAPNPEHPCLGVRERPRRNRGACGEGVRVRKLRFIPDLVRTLFEAGRSPAPPRMAPWPPGAAPGETR